jgi:hypothetical protein
MLGIEIIIIISLLIIGLPMTILGYRMINLFKRDESAETAFLFDKKYSPILRFGGVVLVTISVYLMAN